MTACNRHTDETDPLPAGDGHAQSQDRCRTPERVGFFTKTQSKGDDAFSLIETLVAVAMVAIGFLGAFATAVHAGKLVSVADEDARACTGIEQRLDKLRLLTWPELTDGTGITTKVWTARPEPTADMTVTQETLTISPWDVVAAKTLTATWNGTSSPSVGFNAAAQPLSDASAVKVVATLTWSGRRSGRTQTRSLVTIISRGGISKSALP